MSHPFLIKATSHYDRLARRLLRQHPELDSLEDKMRNTLSIDPYNVTRRYKIKKLEGVNQGDGQYRFRIERFRFRYDIYGKEVILHSCMLRDNRAYK